MSNPETVKVQLPVASMERDPGALIYDRNRVHPTVRRLTPAEQSLVAGALKCFCHATWAERDGWTLIDRAPDQDW